MPDALNQISQSETENNLSMDSSSERSRDAINFVFQGKGGIGKTLAASWIAEHLREIGRNVLCIDADPQQKTLAKIKALDVRPVKLIFKDKTGQTRLNTPEMDSLFSEMLDGEGSVVFDCGGSGYERVTSYLLSNDTIDTLAEVRRVVVHVIVVGGRDLIDTCEELANIVGRFPPLVEIIVWVNPHFGEVELNGIPIEESAFIRENGTRISGFVQMPLLQVDYTSDYFKCMIDNHLTFGEVLDKNNTDWNAISKLRMRKIWSGIKSQISEVVG